MTQWTDFIKEYAKQHKIEYSQAMTSPEVSELYREKYGLVKHRGRTRKAPKHETQGQPKKYATEEERKAKKREQSNKSIKKIRAERPRSPSPAPSESDEEPYVPADHIIYGDVPDWIRYGTDKLKTAYPSRDVSPPSEDEIAYQKALDLAQEKYSDDGLPTYEEEMREHFVESLIEKLDSLVLKIKEDEENAVILQKRAIKEAEFLKKHGHHPKRIQELIKQIAREKELISKGRRLIWFNSPEDERKYYQKKREYESPPRRRATTPPGRPPEPPEPPKQPYKAYSSIARREAIRAFLR